VFGINGSFLVEVLAFLTPYRSDTSVGNMNYKQVMQFCLFFKYSHG